MKIQNTWASMSTKFTRLRRDKTTVAIVEGNRIGRSSPLRGTGVSPLVATRLQGGRCWRQLGVAPAHCTHASLNLADPCRSLAIRNAETSD